MHRSHPLETASTSDTDCVFIETWEYKPEINVQFHRAIYPALHAFVTEPSEPVSSAPEFSGNSWARVFRNEI